MPAFSFGLDDIPKVNCPDYTCTGGVIALLNTAGEERPTPPMATKLLRATAALFMSHV